MKYINIKEKISKYNGSIKEDNNHNYILSGKFNPDVVDFNGRILDYYTSDNNNLNIVRNSGNIEWKLELSEEKMDHFEDLFRGPEWEKSEWRRHNRELRNKQRRKRERKVKKRMREVKHEVNNGVR